MIGIRFLQPAQGKDHGQVLMMWIGWLFVSIEIDLDNDVVVLVSDRRPNGFAWCYATGHPISTWRHPT